jgi:hypothetical protein
MERIANPFVLAKAPSEPFRPNLSILGAAQAEPDLAAMGFGKPSQSSPPLPGGVTFPQGAAMGVPLDQAIFGTMNALEIPIFSQVVTANGRAMLGRQATVSEKPESQERARSFLGDEADGELFGPGLLGRQASAKAKAPQAGNQYTIQSSAMSRYHHFHI